MLIFGPVWLPKPDPISEPKSIFVYPISDEVQTAEIDTLIQTKRNMHNYTSVAATEPIFFFSFTMKPAK